jgi:hypothetical protein
MVTLLGPSPSQFGSQSTSLKARVTGGQCYDFKKYFRRKMEGKMAFLIQNTASLCQKWIITLDS